VCVPGGLPPSFWGGGWFAGDLPDTGRLIFDGVMGDGIERVPRGISFQPGLTVDVDPGVDAVSLSIPHHDGDMH